MTSTLPANADIAQLRRRAKELLRDARASDPTALQRLAGVAYDANAATLSDAHTVLAREHGFTSWPKLRAAVAQLDQERPAFGVAQSVFRNKTEGQALFTANIFVEGAMDAGWEPGPLPDALVFTFHGIYAHLLANDSRFERNMRLAPSNSTMFTTVSDNPRIGVTCLSPGATAMVGQVENQIALGGASRFVIVGTAGSIRTDVKPGAVLVVTSAVRDDGISQHYLPPETYVHADETLTGALASALRDQGVAPTLGSTWTVPTPYRSTADEVEQLAAAGVAVVECEVASLLAVAEAHGVAAGACLSVVSSLVEQNRAVTLIPADAAAALEAALSALGLPPPL